MEKTITIPIEHLILLLAGSHIAAYWEAGTMCKDLCQVIDLYVNKLPILCDKETLVEYKQKLRTEYGCDFL